ncbi:MULTISPECIES: hypothetical protein [Streptomyces]|uniref:Uncharacterized protein n=1 Tax=Streptomyces ramulosus TaxID=47762 RepID=A0ABW1FHJ9_9ACTN
MRKPIRLALATAAAGALSAAGITAADASTANPQAIHAAAHLNAAGEFAPYVDMSNSAADMLDTAITDHGVKTYTAASPSAPVATTSGATRSPSATTRTPIRRSPKPRPRAPT